MPDSRNRLKELLATLTEAQRKIAEKRKHVPSDAAAYKGIVSKASFYNYRRECPGFKEAMELAAAVSEETASDMALIKAEGTDIKEIARQQLTALSNLLPEVFEKLFDIALKGNKENDQLKAIAKICELFGLDSKVLRPQMLTIMQQNISNWVHPVTWSPGVLDNLIDLDADFSGDEIIEGEFRIIEDADSKTD